ncbi:hypothetical protein [Sinomicrobium oceani]|uniref:hypothetical protein n=1 Tax=Sinomicrobium oceani TaxID=1150368 RepID=UPI00227D3E1B|nr:hypothetical protein [Sinomicrobium oceani]
MLSYLKFLWRSTNQHGVHSPFVYAYVTRGLYKAYRFRGPRACKILFRTLAYFKVPDITITEEHPALTGLLKGYFPGIPIVPSGGKLYYFNAGLQPDDVPGLLNIAKSDPDRILVIEGIHRRKTSARAWKMIRTNPSITVTVDLFYAGVVFFREGQARENFIIRP